MNSSIHLDVNLSKARGRQRVESKWDEGGLACGFACSADLVAGRVLIERVAQENQARGVLPGSGAGDPARSA